MIVTSHSTKETQNLAHRIAKELKPGSILTLKGDLGAGKTTFTQFLGQALGITKPITSPTFTLMKHYSLPNSIGDLLHLDLYRLESDQDLHSIDLNELIDYGHHIIVIEWPERLVTHLPSHTIDIQFFNINDTTRRIHLNNLSLSHLQ